MKNAAKKYIAILLTLIMVLNIVPITSLSEENDGTTKPVSVMTKLGTGKSNPYKYIISILNSDDHVVTPDLPTDLNDNNWALVSRLVKQNEEPYFAVTDLASLSSISSDNAIESFALQATTTEEGTTNLYYLVPADAIYVGGDSVTTVLIHKKESGQTDEKCVLAAFNNDTNAGTAYKLGDAIGKYEVIQSMDSSGVAYITLKEASSPTIKVNYKNEGAMVQGSSLLNDDNYYVYARLTDDPTYGFVAKLPKDNTLNSTTNTYNPAVIPGVVFENSENKEKYLIADKSFEVFLVKADKAGYTDNLSVSNCYDTKVGYGQYCTFINNGAVVEASQLDMSQAYGSKGHQAEITINQIPPITIKSTIDPVATLSSHYFLLLEMIENGQKYYALEKLDLSKAEKNNYQGINFLTKSDGIGKYYYTGTQQLNGYVITSSVDNLSLSDAVERQGCSRFASGTMTGDLYKATIGQNDREVSVDFKKVTFGSGTDHGVEIHFYQQDAATPINPRISSSTEKYYLLSTLTDKGTGSSGQHIAYAITSVDFSNLESPVGELTENIKGIGTGDDSQYKLIDSNGNELNSKIPYDTEKFDFSTRIFKKSDLPDNYLDAIKGSDEVTGFDFMSNEQSEDGSKHIIKLHAAHETKTYQVKLEFDPNSPAITTNDKLYLYVRLDHRSNANQHEYFLTSAPVTIENDKESATISIDPSEWKDLNGNSLNDFKFTGNETAYVRIVKANGNSLTIQNAANVTECTIIGEGQMAKAYEVSYAKKRTKDIINNNGSYTTSVTDYVQLTKIPVSNDFNYTSILGEAVYYGIVVDDFDQKNHIQSNFAVNEYHSNNNIVEADLAANSGTIIAAYAEEIETGTGKIINIGESHSGEVLFYHSNGNLTNPLVNPRDFVFSVKTSKEELNGIVNSMLAHGENISNILMSKKITFTPADPGDNASHIEIDTTDFASDATIYLDGDRLTKWLAKGGGLRITKHPDQVLVFNFDTSTDVTLSEMYVRTDPTQDWGPENKSDTPVSKNDPHNTIIDNMAQHIVWNLRSASHVNIGISTGMFLVPNGTVEVTSTSSGWIIGKNFRNPGGEWHSVYGQMPSITTTNLYVEKTIDGGVPKGDQKFEFSLERLTSKHEWVPVQIGVITLGNGGTEAVFRKTNDNGTITFDGINSMEDGWNLYRIKEDGISQGTNGAYNIDTKYVYALVEYQVMISHGNEVHVAKNPTYYIETEGEPDFYLDSSNFNVSAASAPLAYQESDW